MNGGEDKRYLRIGGIITGPYEVEVIRTRQRRGELPKDAETSLDKKLWEPLWPRLRLEDLPPPDRLPPGVPPLPALPVPPTEEEEIALPPPAVQSPGPEPLTPIHCGAALLGQLWNLAFFRLVLQTAPRKWRIAGSWLLWALTVLTWELALAGFGPRFGWTMTHWYGWLLLALLLLADLGLMTLLEVRRPFPEKESPEWGEAFTRATALVAIVLAAATLLIGLWPPPGTAGVRAWCRRILAVYAGFWAVGNWQHGVHSICEREFGWKPGWPLGWSTLLLMGQCGILPGAIGLLLFFFR